MRPAVLQRPLLRLALHEGIGSTDGAGLGQAVTEVRAAQSSVFHIKWLWFVRLGVGVWPETAETPAIVGTHCPHRTHRQAPVV